MWGATSGQRFDRLVVLISIHAPRVGSDAHSPWTCYPHTYFNPRSPCGERRQPRLRRRKSPVDFNPRSPCGERRKDMVDSGSYDDFNPRSPCGERQGVSLKLPSVTGFQSTLPRVGSDVSGGKDSGVITISIHAPRVGSDQPIDLTSRNSLRFQSTLPVGGATSVQHSLVSSICISIHAPRGGSDVHLVVLLCAHGDFNPRSPWGERLFSPVFT